MYWMTTVLLSVVLSMFTVHCSGMSWTKISNRWCRRGAIFPTVEAAQAACLRLGSRACPGVYDEFCDGRKPYLCKGSSFSTGFGGGCLRKSTAPLYRAFKPATNMELKRAIQTCSREYGGLVKSDGDTIGGTGCTLNPAKGKATHAVIWLHGLGDTCEGWSDAMKDLQSDRQIRFILPTARSIPITMNNDDSAPAWADVMGLHFGALEDEAGFKLSFARVKSIIDKTIADGIPASNIVIGGFSQGGALALHTAMRLTFPIAGYVALSAWLPLAISYPAEMTEVAKSAKIFMAHGSKDSVVRPKLGRASYDQLSNQLTTAPTFKTIEGMGHASDPEELKMMASFIESVFQGKKNFVYEDVTQTRQPDGSWLLESSCFLPYPIDEVFQFFQDAHNLETITPEFLNFEVLTPKPIEMRTGALIDYRLHLHGIPLRWRTEIRDWNPPHSFVDMQLSGPYREWHHTHKFVAQDGGTLCTDQVRYRVYGGVLVQRMFVKSDVDRIFRYRLQRMHELFPDKNR